MIKENQINIRIDNDTKKKALLVLQAQGKSLSDEVRKVVEEIAKKYDKKNSK